MLQRISRILDTVGQTDSPLKPTEFFNEGWMLRLVLDHLKNETSRQHRFSFESGAKWFSEGRLPTPFKAGPRGDSNGETRTCADGAIGHLVLGQRGRSDLSLLPSAKQLVVVEAKMFSKLSSGVKHCAEYDQASRYVACIAEVIASADLKPENIDKLAFYVVAPASQIDAGVFGERLTKDSIEQSVQCRVRVFEGDREQWYEEVFKSTLKAIRVELISWETVLDGLPNELHEFYEQCIQFNRPLKRNVVKHV